MASTLTKTTVAKLAQGLAVTFDEEDEPSQVTFYSRANANNYLVRLASWPSVRYMGANKRVWVQATKVAASVLNDGQGE